MSLYTDQKIINGIPIPKEDKKVGITTTPLTIDRTPKFVNKDASNTGVNQVNYPGSESDLYVEGFKKGHKPTGGYDGLYGRGTLTSHLPGYNPGKSFPVPNPEENFKLERLSKLNDITLGKYMCEAKKQFVPITTDKKNFVCLTMKGLQESMVKANQNGLKKTNRGVSFEPYMKPDVNTNNKEIEPLRTPLQHLVTAADTSKSGLQKVFNHTSNGELTSNSGRDLILRQGDPMDPYNDKKIGPTGMGLNPNLQLHSGNTKQNPYLRIIN